MRSMEQFLYVLLFATIALVQVVVRALRQRQEAAAHAQLGSLPEPGGTASQVVAMPRPPPRKEPGGQAASAAARQPAVRARALVPAPRPAHDPAAIRSLLRSPEGLTRSLVLSVIIGKPRSLEPLDGDFLDR